MLFGTAYLLGYILISRLDNDMLNPSFYHIVKQHTADNGELQYDLQLNAAHGVFQGHFPGQPVVPGVFTTQIIQELVEGHTGKKLRFVKARKIKFLMMIDPRVSTDISIKLTVKPDGDEYTADATAFFMNQPCLKINARYATEL